MAAGPLSSRRLLAWLAALTCSAGCRAPGPSIRGAEALPVIWRAPLGRWESGDEGSVARPAHLDGRLFVMQGDAVLALDAADGSRLWRSSPIPYARLTQRMLARDGRVFTAGQGAYAFDAATGRELWRRPIGGRSWSADTVDHEQVYLGGGDSLFVLDVATGAPRWIFDFGREWPFGGRLHGVTLSGDTVYVSGRQWIDARQGGQQAFLVALRRRDGALLWRLRPDSVDGLHWAVAVRGRRIIATGVTDRTPLALDRFTRRIEWSSAVIPGGGIRQGVVIAADTVYAGNLDRHIYAFHLETGRLLWQSARLAGSVDAVALCGDWLVGIDQGIQLLDRRTGRRLVTALHSERDFIVSGPTVVERVLYVTGSSAVYAVRCPG